MQLLRTSCKTTEQIELYNVLPASMNNLLLLDAGFHMLMNAS